MKNKTGYIITIIIGILFLILVYLVATNKPEEGLDGKVDENVIEEPAELIHVKHQYKDGTHIFAGDLIVDNDCSDRLEASVSDTGPTLVFETIDDNPDGPCTKEAFKTYPYKLFHVSPEDTKYSGTVNGVPVRLNLYEISPDEDIDEVDLFIKG